MSARRCPCGSPLRGLVERKAPIDCNADLGHPCDADDGEPCPRCKEEEAYCGTIVAIGEKTVTIQEDGRNRRLSVYEFSFRNRDFDIDAINARNEDVMLHC